MRTDRSRTPPGGAEHAHLAQGPSPGAGGGGPGEGGPTAELHFCSPRPPTESLWDPQAPSPETPRESGSGSSCCPGPKCPHGHPLRVTWPRPEGLLRGRAGGEAIWKTQGGQFWGWCSEGKGRVSYWRDMGVKGPPGTDLWAEAVPLTQLPRTSEPPGLCPGRRERVWDPQFPQNPVSVRWGLRQPAGKD